MKQFTVNPKSKKSSIKGYIRCDDSYQYEFKTLEEYFNFLYDEYGDDLDLAFGDMVGEVASTRFGEPCGVPAVAGNITDDKLIQLYEDWLDLRGGRT